jgi:peptidoglycan/LPS O-acetylase OafA/YrhL
VTTAVDNNAHLHFRRDIQGLRALAIALVVFGHAGVPGLAGGFIGVDVFFVLSGYLITGILVTERFSSGRIRFGKFLGRRLRRLAPAMFLMIIATMFFAGYSLSAVEIRSQFGSLVYATTWTSNFYFALSQFDYFDELATRDFFLHTWSLGVEEQFYLLWPWLIIAALGVAAGRASITVLRQRLLVVLGFVAISSLALCIYWTGDEALLGFYMMPSRGWQFALGALVFLWCHSRSAGSEPAVTPLFSQLAGGAGVILILATAMMLHPGISYPGLNALAPTAGTALLLLAGSGSNIVTSVFSTSVMNWIGDRSYSLYLWHWPVLLFGHAYLITQSASGIVFCIALSLLLADLSYRYVEFPFWKGRFRHASIQHTLAASASAASVVLVVGFTAVVLIGEERKADTAAENYNPLFDMPQFYAKNRDCDTYTKSSQVVPCTVSEGSGSKTALLIGDSIGAQWVPLLKELFSSPDWRVVVLTKSACPIVDEPIFYRVINSEYDICAEWRNAALRHVETLTPDIVFVGSASHYAYDSDQWVAGSGRVFRRLSSATNDVVVISGTPTLSFNGLACLRSAERHAGRRSSSRNCEDSTAIVQASEVALNLKQAAKSYPNVHVLDLNDLVCPNGVCAAASNDGLVIYRDQRHLTTRFVRAQVARVRERLAHIVATNASANDAVMASNEDSDPR